MIFDLNDWQTPNVGMHCRTLKQALFFTSYLRKAGRKWSPCIQYENRTTTELFYKEKDSEGLVFYFNRSAYDPYRAVLRSTVDTILEFEDFKWPGYSCGYEESDVTLSEILGIGDCNEI